MQFMNWLHKVICRNFFPIEISILVDQKNFQWFSKSDKQIKKKGSFYPLTLFIFTFFIFLGTFTDFSHFLLHFPFFKTFFDLPHFPQLVGKNFLVESLLGAHIFSTQHPGPGVLTFIKGAQVGIY